MKSLSLNESHTYCKLINILGTKRRYAAKVMKLKSIYTCVASKHTSCDDAYEATTKKEFDAERKTKKTNFRPKWQPLSKSTKNSIKQGENTGELILPVTQASTTSDKTNSLVKGPPNSPTYNQSLLDQRPSPGKIPMKCKNA